MRTGCASEEALRPRWLTSRSNMLRRALPHQPGPKAPFSVLRSVCIFPKVLFFWGAKEGGIEHPQSLAALGPKNPSRRSPIPSRTVRKALPNPLARFTATKGQPSGAPLKCATTSLCVFLTP